MKLNIVISDVNAEIGSTRVKFKPSKDGSTLFTFIHYNTLVDNDQSVDLFADSILYTLAQNRDFPGMSDINISICQEIGGSLYEGLISDAILKLNEKYNIDIDRIECVKQKTGWGFVSTESNITLTPETDIMERIKTTSSHINDRRIKDLFAYSQNDDDDDEDEDDEEEDFDFMKYAGYEDDDDDYDDRKSSDRIKTSRAVDNKKMKKAIKRHDVIIYDGKKGKNIREHDEKVFKRVLKELYPGKEKYMKKFRKHLLERIMRNTMISKKDFKKLLENVEKKSKGKSKSKSSKQRYSKSTTVGGFKIACPSFYDPSK